MSSIRQTLWTQNTTEAMADRGDYIQEKWRETKIIWVLEKEKVFPTNAISLQAHKKPILM